MSRIIAKTFIATTCLALTGCAYLPVGLRPEVEDVRASITGIDFQAVDLIFDLDVRNPFLSAIHAPGFAYGLEIEGIQILENEGYAEIDLPARGVGTVRLPVRLTYRDIWRVVQSLAGAPEAAYTLHGAFAVPAMGSTYDVPFSYSGNFPVLRVPTFTAVNFEPSGISLSGASIAGDAQVTNPNVFGVGLEDLGYTLMIGDIRVGRLSASTLGRLGAGETGTLSFTGRISARDALRDLIAGRSLGVPRLSASGALATPYGSKRFGDDQP